MKTLLLTCEKESDIALCGQILRDGGIVAIPTETVYGLAANALNLQAVAGIFAAKGRPGDNPLIVHISELEQIYRLSTELSESALALAKAFWPGPMTLVVPKSELVPSCVSAGLDTVGVRMPQSREARAVISAAGVPLAAPSANISGKPSPTCFEHVLEDMDGRIDAIIDGGACTVGLESTVIDTTCTPVKILRPGGITAAMIEQLLGEVSHDEAVFRKMESGEKPRAPGMKYRHYAPSSPMTVFEGTPDDTARDIKNRLEKGERVLCFDEYANLFENAVTYGSCADSEGQNRKLFAALRAFDSLSQSAILAQAPCRYGLTAAASNRIKKAAGFSVISSTPIEIIGVTGCSGSGKSLLAACSGLHYVDSDRVYARLLRENKDMTNAIKAAFSDCFEGGTLDRRRLAVRIFSCADDKAVLEKITHPYVIAELKIEVERAINAGERAIILDVPLLFESGVSRLCTVTVGVLCDRSDAVERIVGRDGISVQAAEMRLAGQPCDEYYRAMCNILIENYDLDTYKKQINHFLENII